MNDARLIHDYEQIKKKALDGNLELRIDRRTGNFELHAPLKPQSLIIATPNLETISHYIEGVTYGRNNPAS